MLPVFCLWNEVNAMDNFRNTEHNNRLRQQSKKRLDAEEAEVELLLSALHCETI